MLQSLVSVGTRNARNGIFMLPLRSSFCSVSGRVRVPTSLSLSRTALPCRISSPILPKSANSRYFATTPEEQDDEPNPAFQWKSFLLMATVSACLYLVYQNRKTDYESKKSKKIDSVGVPDLGGPFTLVDHNGKVVTTSNLRDKFKLIYFGFTFCPDVCPVELEKMARALEIIKKKSPRLAGKLLPLFISVDPRRDSVDQLREYLKDFHPDIIGLTGTPEQITDCCRAYRVYSSKTNNDEDDDYLVDHTIFFYFMSPEDTFVNYYGQLKTDVEIATDIMDRMRAADSSSSYAEALVQDFQDWIQSFKS